MRGHTKSAVQRFSPTDRRCLERALSVAREARLYRRIEAVLLVAEGQPISEAARRVRATRFSVRGWTERYLATHDAAALADRPRRGRPRAGWRAGDVLLCGDWTLLRLFPPLRAAWARKGTQATVPITGA